MSGMSGAGHDMTSHSGQATRPPAQTGHAAMGHAMPTAPSSAPVATGHENMEHAMPMTSPPGVPADPHAGHGAKGGLQ
ncbi:hypothetical protein [Pandoraea oxalativorans]|uniref:hypothetical protein n=1 Tax=Pandoraea oxalativorans TaxID=573737 RepID=UPI0012F51FBD|nr:hypothetical protein [Pandoraea oxalativorans]